LIKLFVNPTNNLIQIVPFSTFDKNSGVMKSISAFFLVLTMFVYGQAQQKDIEIFEKKEGNKNIVMARNTGKVPYLVTIKINAKGMDVTPGIAVEGVVPAGYMKEMATLVPRPGESWSYGYDVSYMEHTGQDPKTTTPSPQTKQESSSGDQAAIENPNATATIPKASLSTAPIIVYTQVGCGRCSYVKKEMTAKGIAFEEVDVNSGSPDATNMWKQLRDGGFTGDSVTMPVVKVNGQLHYNIKDLAGFVSGLKQ
jgi:glutaredoxin